MTQGSGCTSNVAFARVSLTLLKGDVAASLQMRILVLDLVLAKSRFRGWRRVAQQGMKRQ